MNKQLLKKIATIEGVPAGFLAKNVKEGTAVIPNNRLKRVTKPCAIGMGLRTKINANIGTSGDFSNIDFELRKLKAAEELGADTVMDLSTSRDLVKARAKMLEKAQIPLGTVPIYETAVLGSRKYGNLTDIPENFFIDTIKSQAKEGVDFFTIHAGVNRHTLATLKEKKRVMGVVSRGGAILMEWMLKNSKENPLYKFFDEIIDIARDYDITLSLGDGLRPGSVVDATDAPQVAELLVLGRLREAAFKKGVQVIIEGPGHIPINQIKMNVELEKSVCNGAPFYVLGPLVTDIAPGYDHLTGAIGGALAAAYGADFLCYVTPAEHLRLPTIQDVREGVIASRIAAHAGDLAKGAPDAAGKDLAISKARFLRDWKKQFELAVDPEKCKAYRKSSTPARSDVCTMCSDYCSLKISEKCLVTTDERTMDVVTRE